MNPLVNSLTETELMLVRETEPDRLAGLDEDGLVAVHERIRRARNKYTKSYRREASAKVSEQGGRGKARPRNTRNAQKAEVFEDALARVSRSLAVAARHSAAELKAERLRAARAERNPAPPGPGRRSAPPMSSQRSQRPPASAPARRRRHASTKAMGARRQTKRDTP